MKKVLLIMVVLLSAGMFSACSSDDDTFDDSFVPQKEDYVDRVYEKTGYVCYDTVEECWYIDIKLPPLPDGAAYFDSAILYYTYALPQAYQQKGLEVKVSGDIYDYHFRNENHIIFGGHKYYYIKLRHIERAG